MKRFWLFLPLALLLAGMTFPGGGRERSVVVVLSLDGFRHDYPDRFPYGAFARLKREGVVARRLEPSFPASTFPSQMTLATGCYPDRHGILNNHFLDAERGEFHREEDPSWMHCEPIWVTAERQGVRAAVSNWVGSYGAWNGIEATYHDDAFTPRSDRESLRRILGWLRLPQPRRPRLILAHLAGADHAGHEFGPNSGEVTERVKREDEILGEFLDELSRAPHPERVTLLVMTDHGMAPVQETVDPRIVLDLAGIAHRTFYSGGCGNVYLNRDSERERATSLLTEIAGMEVFPRDRLPADLHYFFPGRTGDLVLVAPVGKAFGREEGNGRGEMKGVHGYRGTEPVMSGVFFAWGAGVEKGKRAGVVRAADLHSVISALLAVKPSGQAEGKIPPGILRPR